MNIKILLIFLLFLGEINSKINQAPTKEPKNNPKIKSQNQNRKCCTLNLEYGSVRLSRICLEKEITSFEIVNLVTSTPCTILENIFLKDNSGKNYKPVSYVGISSCTDSIKLKIQSEQIFLWNFQKLNLQAKSFSMGEILIPQFPDAWHWDDVDISSCKWE